MKVLKPSPKQYLALVQAHRRGNRAGYDRVAQAVGWNRQEADYIWNEFLRQINLEHGDKNPSTATRTEVRSPTRTSTATKADTRGNVTVTGGAGAGANTTVHIRKNPGSVRIVYNRLLGGWYVVTGPHQTPLNGRFNSKLDAEAWLRDRQSARDAKNPRRRSTMMKCPIHGRCRGCLAATGGLGGGMRRRRRRHHRNPFSKSSTPARHESEPRRSSGGGGGGKRSIMPIILGGIALVFLLPKLTGAGGILGGLGSGTGLFGLGANQGQLRNVPGYGNVYVSPTQTPGSTYVPGYGYVQGGGSNVFTSALAPLLSAGISGILQGISGSIANATGPGTGGTPGSSGGSGSIWAGMVDVGGGVTGAFDTAGAWRYYDAEGTVVSEAEIAAKQDAYYAAIRDQGLTGDTGGFGGVSDPGVDWWTEGEPVSWWTGYDQAQADAEYMDFTLVAPGAGDEIAQWWASLGG